MSNSKFKKKQIILLGIILFTSIFSSHCTPKTYINELESSPSATYQPSQNSTDTTYDLNVPTLSDDESTGTVEALLTQVINSQTQIARSTTISPDFDPGTATAQTALEYTQDHTRVIGQNEDMVVYYSMYQKVDEDISKYIINYKKLCVWSSIFGYKELAPDFPEISSSFFKAAISNNKQLISYFYSDYSYDEDEVEGGFVGPKSTSLFIHDLESGENIKVMTEYNPPTFFNDMYQIVWVNNDQQILFLFPAYIECTEDDPGTVSYNSTNRLFLYDLENQSIKQILEVPLIDKLLYISNINKVIITHPRHVDIVDLQTLESNRLLVFEWVAVDTDYISSPPVIKHPSLDLYYVAVTRDVIYDNDTAKPISSTIYIFEIDGSSDNAKELAIIEDTLYSYDPPIITQDGLWLVYKPKPSKSPYYFINTISGETLVRDITIDEYRDIQNASNTPTPDYGSPWLSGCPPSH